MPLTLPGSVLGHPVRRREDPRLVSGSGRYVDDVPLEGCLFAAFVRSPLAHARVGAADRARAAALPGVVAVWVAADLELPARLGAPMLPAVLARQPLAPDRARYVGDPVAVVIATTRQAAADAAQALEIDWEELPVVVDPQAALAPEAPLLWPEHGSNVVHESAFGGEDGDVLAGAEVVVRARFRNQRLAPVPLETNAIAAAPDPSSGGLVVWASCQGPFQVRQAIAAALGLDESQVRVVAPEVGGGFGAKMSVYPEQVVVAAAARRLGRPVRWMESRTENLLNMVHGRGQLQDVELGARRDGTLVGLRVRVIADAGAYPAIGAILPTFTGMMLSGVYRVPRIDYRARSVTTNTATVAAYRGAGRPEAVVLVERAMDMLAAELGRDPADLRRQNLIPAADFPLTTSAGARYDSGDYARALDEALRIAGYRELRAEQARRRAAGDRRLLGIGLATYVEVTGGPIPSEYGSVEVSEGGAVLVKAGTTASGQGHETTYAQLAAEILGVPVEAVSVVQSDTLTVARGMGTVGSRSMQTGGSAVALAGERVVEAARQVAAGLLEADAADVVRFPDGRFGVAGSPARSLGWAELAAAAPGGLRAEADFEQPGRTFPFGAHVAITETDLETGEVRLLRHIAVDDCGRVLNPLLAEGQVQGGIAQGVAQALLEEVVYDDRGNPLTATLLDYLVPTANEIPVPELGRTETPSPLNALGVKGIGESGTIGATAAVLNAGVDALAHLGVRHLDMPLTPEKVWRAIRAAAR